MFWNFFFCFYGPSQEPAQARLINRKKKTRIPGNGARKKATGALIRPEKLTDHNTRIYWEICRRDFIENKKTNIMCCLYTRSQLSVREICPCWKTLLSVLMAVFCFCFHFSQLLCLYVCLRRGSPSSGAVLARSTINGSSKCNGNEILWGSGENSSIWMIIECNYLYQSPSLTMFDL